jgi:2-keto-4-pentenoate hydratase/2-oxohepta-3-ene-1,7-dioic acid hydratase in catechol pathway
MRLVTYRVGNLPARPGALVDGGRAVVALPAPNVLAIVEGGQNALDRAAEALKRPSREAVFPLAEVTLLAPIPQPPQMRDFLCFEKHLQQAFAAVAKLRGTEARIPKIWYERPIFYHPNRFNVCGTGADVPWPRYTERLDFELEFGCYIGKPGKDIPRERAREHVFGYTIFNDFSARDEQTLEMMGQLGPGKGKDFDNSNVMGPCLVTADEIENVYDLAMICRVNGEEWGRGNSRDLHCPRVALGDRASGRVLRLGHRRRRLRPRAHAVPRARRRGRARGGRDRDTEEPRRALRPNGPWDCSGRAPLVRIGGARNRATYKLGGTTCVWAQRRASRRSCWRASPSPQKQGPSQWTATPASESARG